MADASDKSQLEPRVVGELASADGSEQAEAESRIQPSHAEHLIESNFKLVVL